MRVFFFARYSTNPQEDFAVYEEHESTYDERLAISIVDKLKLTIEALKSEPPIQTLKYLRLLDRTFGFKDLNNMLEDVKLHLSTLGPYGGFKAILSYMIQLECLKRHCQDLNLLAMYSYILTAFGFIKNLLTERMNKYCAKDQFYQFSSDKILKLVDIFRNFRMKSSEELSAIIFTQRRFTAKIVYHILQGLSECDPEFSYLKPDYIVGFNNNPFNSTREGLFVLKKNKQVIEAFRNKEINVIVSSSVLEEGIDMQKCTLVVRYDLPSNYRGYIQSKGRARHKESLFYMLISTKDYDTFSKKYKEFQTVEQIVNNVSMLM